MPSFTFVSTANAFVLRGATPVFVDIRPDTLNLDERLVEAAITPRTRAIVAVHYAGVGCEMDAICASPRRHGLVVIEDAAQALLAQLQGRPLGARHLAAISFHETKNVIAGEGGALIDQRRAVRRARGDHLGEGHRPIAVPARPSGQVPWMDIGSSFLPSEITAAFLWAQLEERRRRSRQAPGDLEPLPRRVRARWKRRAAAPADRPRRLPAQRPPLLPAAADPAVRSDVLDRLNAAASTRSSTTCRCIVAGRAAVSAARRLDAAHRRFSSARLRSTAAVDRDGRRRAGDDLVDSAEGKRRGRQRTMMRL